MRVLIISNIYPPGYIGGYELGAAEIADGLISRGHSVEVLTSDYFIDDSRADEGSVDKPRVERTLDCPGISLSPSEAVRRAGLAGFVLPKNLRVVAGRLKSWKPDVVLCFNLAGLGAPSLLHLIVSCGMRPVLYLMDHVFITMCSDPPRRRSYEQIFPAKGWIDKTKFLFMSQTLRSEVENALGYTISGSDIVPGWINDSEILPLRQRVEDGVTRFIFASRIAPHKGVDILLSAARALLDGGQSSFIIDIFGAGDVGPLMQRITALRLSNNVFFKGSAPKVELAARFWNYDALLFPTWHREPFGFVVPEAAVAGCIPVMSFGAGVSEWYLDGVDCIKIAQDVESLAAAMSNIAAMPPDSLLNMRRHAQMTTHRHLRFGNALDRIEQVLTEAAGSSLRDPRVVEGALAILTEVWRQVVAA